MSDAICYRPIGIIHSGHHDPDHGPIQPCYADGCTGTVEIFEEFAKGLQDIEGYSHIYLLYHLDRAQPGSLLVKPFLQDIKHGIFSTRAPGRPNPIGMSFVRLLSREGNLLHIANIDTLDGTPLLDIKPYSRRIDCVIGTRDGWQDEVDDTTAAIRGRR